MMEHVRWTLSAACLIAGLVDVVVGLVGLGARGWNDSWFTFAVAASFLIMAVCLYLLTICTCRQNEEALDDYLTTIDGTDVAAVKK